MTFTLRSAGPPAVVVMRASSNMWSTSPRREPDVSMGAGREMKLARIDLVSQGIL